MIFNLYDFYVFFYNYRLFILYIHHKKKYKNINTNNKVISEIMNDNKDFIEFMKKIGFVMTNDHKLKFIEHPKILDYTKTIMVA